MKSRNPEPQLDLRLFRFRGRTVLLDADSASLYDVTTKRLLEQVRRNPVRFPPDYCFQLSAEEFAALRSQIATSNTGRGGRRYAPWVFAEHGALMAATVLNSERAVAMSHYVIRAFVRMREELLGQANLEKRLAEIERTLIGNDTALRDLYRKIKPLLLPAAVKPKREIRFHVKDQLTATEQDWQTKSSRRGCASRTGSVPNRTTNRLAKAITKARRSRKSKRREKTDRKSREG